MWKMIASADKNWGIGEKNALLVQIPRDMQRFREKTMGQIVVMGRKTLESLPNGLPLAGRVNVILSSRPSYSVKNAVVVHSIEELMTFLREQEEEVYVIGGESIYKQLLPYCDTVLLTKINHTYSCDAYFPNMDEQEEWELVSESEEHTYFDLEYTFTIYERRGDVSNG